MKRNMRRTQIKVDNFEATLGSQFGDHLGDYENSFNSRILIESCTKITHTRIACLKPYLLVHQLLHRGLSADRVSESNGMAAEEISTHTRRGGHQFWRGVLGTLGRGSKKMAAASWHKPYRSQTGCSSCTFFIDARDICPPTRPPYVLSRASIKK